MKASPSRSRRVDRLRVLTVVTLLGSSGALASLIAGCVRDSDEAPRPSGAGLVTRIAHDVADAAPASPSAPDAAP